MSVQKLKANEFALSNGNIMNDTSKKTSVMFSKPDANGYLEMKITFFIQANQVHSGSASDEDITNKTGDCGVFTFNQEYFKDTNPPEFVMDAAASEEITLLSAIKILTDGVKGNHGVAFLGNQEKDKN